MRHLSGCEAGNFGGCTCHEIRASRMAKVNAVKAKQALEDAVRDIIARGCGCHRECQALVGPAVYCGCEVDAVEIIELVLSSTLSSQMHQTQGE